MMPDRTVHRAVRAGIATLPTEAAHGGKRPRRQNHAYIKAEMDDLLVRARTQRTEDAIRAYSARKSQ